MAVVTPTRLVEHMLVMEKMDLCKVRSKDEDDKTGKQFCVGFDSGAPRVLFLQIEENGGGLGCGDLQRAQRRIYLASVSVHIHKDDLKVMVQSIQTSSNQKVKV